MLEKKCTLNLGMTSLKFQVLSFFEITVRNNNSETTTVLMLDLISLNKLVNFK